jgi:predicted permease
LPFANADRIVRIFFNSDTFAKFPMNPNDFRDFRDRTQAFEGLAAITRTDRQLSGVGEPVMLRGFQITSGYFSVLGLTPERGREFTRDEELPDRGRVVILSNRIWRTAFASDPNIVGRTITLNALPFTVVGVMPSTVQHPGNVYHSVADGDTVDIWCPFTMPTDRNNRGSHFLDTFGRLKPGVTAAQGNADLSAMLSQLANENPSDKGWRVFTTQLYDEMVGRTQRMLFVLLGAVVLLLLIACVNAANLLLARANARQREIAVRSALGAARFRIIRQLLTESLLIALIGGALGSLLALGGVRVLVAALPSGFPRAAEIHLNPTVFAFTLGVAVLTGLLFGLVPALTASRTDLQQSLRESGRNTAGSGRQLRLRNLLVVGETGLACILLIGAGLMLHSFVNLLRTDPGFRPHQVLTASISLPYEHYKLDKDIARFSSNLTRELSSLPGVRFAGVGSDVPWTGYDENAGGFTVEGRSSEYNDKTTARYHVASSGYFQALGIPLLKGRFFNDRDSDGAEVALIVNETMAKRYWPGEDAVGKRITYADHPQDKDWWRIVGVVADVKDRPDSETAKPAFWWTQTQQPFRNLSVVLNSNAGSNAAISQLRQTMHGLDPDLAIDEVRFMNQITDASVADHRFALFLVGLFAGLALILATIGMYGVISYNVNQRMSEFGIRMALGAKPRNLIGLVVGQGMKLGVIGAAIGLLLAAGLSRLLGSLLYEVSGRDMITFVTVALLALITTAAACYIPARRAAGVDPMRSLGSE